MEERGIALAPLDSRAGRRIAPVASLVRCLDRDAAEAVVARVSRDGNDDVTKFLD